MRLDLVLSGLGGQGIIFAGRLLTWIALKKKWPVIGAETHGMAQRGGSVVAHLRFGQAAGSLVGQGQADGLIAFAEEEAYRNLAFLKKGGDLFANAKAFPWPQAAGYLEKQKITAHAADIDAVALENGLPRAGNLIMLGFTCAAGALPFSLGELEEAVHGVTPERFLQANLQAIELGAAQAG